MKKAAIVSSLVLAASVIVFLGVAAVTSINRANGNEWWPGTDAASNWPAVLGFASINLMWVSAATTLVLLLALAVRRAARGRVPQR